MNLRIEQKELIGSLCRRLGVEQLDLFGSAARGESRADSDIDALVRFDREQGELFRRYFDLKEGLEDVFSKPVELVVETAIRNPYFRKAIERDRISLYAA